MARPSTRAPGTPKKHGAELLARWQATHEHTQQEAATELDTFTKDNPHVGTVYADMALLLREGRAETLKEAYEKATWAHPQLRTALLEEQQKAKDAERAQRARQAQRAGAINVRTSPGTTPSMPKSIRETMEATFDAIHAA